MKVLSGNAPPDLFFAIKSRDIKTGIAGHDSFDITQPRGVDPRYLAVIKTVLIQIQVAPEEIDMLQFPLEKPARPFFIPVPTKVYQFLLSRDDTYFLSGFLEDFIAAIPVRHMTAYCYIKVIRVVFLMGRPKLEQEFRLAQAISHYPQVHRFVRDAIAMGGVPCYRFSRGQAGFPIPCFQQFRWARSVVLHVAAIYNRISCFFQATYRPSFEGICG